MPNHFRNRRSIRLAGYDYAEEGAYFVTICAYDRECLFGEIAGEIMQINAQGQVVQKCWDDLPTHYPYVALDEFVVMPNHIHAIIVIDRKSDLKTNATLETVGAGLRPALATDQTTRSSPIKRHGLSEVVRAFKSFSARRINELREMPGTPVWQRNYFEHIIRDEKSLNSIRQYIQSNPAQWAYDDENPTKLESTRP